MLVRELIADDIPPVKTSDSGLFALSMMDEYRVNHLPIVNNKDFLGLISEDDILGFDHPEEAIGSHKLSLVKPFVYEHRHIYEAIKLVAELKLTLVPILNQDNTYKGHVPLMTLAREFSHLASMQEPGGMLILEVNANDYSLQEIAQIAEINDAKMLSFYVTTHQDSMKLDITIKFNKEDISSILQAFDRYNYVVKASYTDERFKEDWDDRFDEFMNYLNM